MRKIPVCTTTFFWISCWSNFIVVFSTNFKEHNLQSENIPHMMDNVVLLWSYTGHFSWLSIISFELPTSAVSTATTTVFKAWILKIVTPDYRQVFHYLYEVWSGLYSKRFNLIEFENTEKSCLPNSSSRTSECLVAWRSIVDVSLSSTKKVLSPEIKH